MLRKVSKSECHKSKEEQTYILDRGRLSDQKLKSLQEMIKSQSSAENHLVGHSDVAWRTSCGIEHFDDVNSRKLHSASDPIIPMGDNGDNVVIGRSVSSPVRNRKIARKCNESGEEENLPATPLLPGKIRVELFKGKPKKDLRPTEKGRGKSDEHMAKSGAASGKASLNKDSKKGSSFGAGRATAVQTDNSHSKSAASNKRLQNEADIRAYKRGLEVAWQVIGPPKVQLRQVKRKSPELIGKLKTGFKSSSSQQSKKLAEKRPSLEEGSSLSDKLEGTTEFEDNASTERNSSDIIDMSKLPNEAKSIAQDLETMKAQDKSKEVKAKGRAYKSKVPEDKPKPAKDFHCAKKVKPDTDREAIRSYIKQQRLARHSAEQQRRAEQARIEREKQARLQAVLEHQQAVARIPVRALLPEVAARPSQRVIKFDSEDKIEADEVASFGLSDVVAESQQTDNTNMATVADDNRPLNLISSVIPDSGRNRRVCAILESAISLQVKLRAEVERVERFISKRAAPGSAITDNALEIESLKSPNVLNVSDETIGSKQPPSLLQELTAVSEAEVPSISPLQIPSMRDSSTSPIFTSPGKGDGSSVAHKVTPISKSKSPGKQVRIVPTEQAKDGSRLRDYETSQTSILSAAPQDSTDGWNDTSNTTLSLVNTVHVLPVKDDPWNVANVFRRSFAFGTTPSRDSHQRNCVDAELQTTFVSPPRFTSDAAVQSMLTPNAADTFIDLQIPTIQSQPDLVEACIQTSASPTRLPDEHSDASAMSFFPLSPKTSRVADILKEEAESERMPPEVLDARLHAELDLLASLDGYHRQLDDLDRMRTVNQQNTDVAGLVTLMNTVENHVRSSLQTQQETPPSRSPTRSKTSVPKEHQSQSRAREDVAQRQHVERPPVSVAVTHTLPQGMPFQEQGGAQQNAIVAVELRQDIERRFQALEAATGRRLAADSERLLEAHLRTSIAVSDLTRQLADMQRNSLVAIEERQSNLSQQRDGSEQQHGPTRYHRRQTFSPPRPPPNVVPMQPQSAEPVTGGLRVLTASAMTVTSTTDTPGQVSEALTGKSTSSSKSIEESAQSVSESSLIPSEAEDDASMEKSEGREGHMDVSLARRIEDHQLLSDFIQQQARQSSLRFRTDIAELTLREREAKRRANTELALLKRRREFLAKNSESKAELDRLDKLRVKVLTAYGKEKKHLENLKKSSTRLASEQRSLADQLRRSLPRTNVTRPGEGDETLEPLSESTFLENQDNDVSMELMQLQLDKIGASDGDPARRRLSKSIVEQLLTGREQMLEERQAIAEQLLMRNAQLDDKEHQVRELEERLTQQLGSPSRRRSSTKKELLVQAIGPAAPVPPQQLLAVPPTQQQQRKQSPLASDVRVLSAGGCTDDDVASLPESLHIIHTAAPVQSDQASTPPGGTSTTAPPIPSSSIIVGEALVLDKTGITQRGHNDEDYSRPATGRSTTPAASVASEIPSAVTEEISETEPQYDDEQFEEDKSSSIAATPVTEKTPRSVTDEVPTMSAVPGAKQVTALRDELEKKRQIVKELKANRDQIKRRREAEKIAKKESHLATKLAQKDEEIKCLEREIVSLQVVSEPEQAIATETEDDSASTEQQLLPGGTTQTTSSARASENDGDEDQFFVTVVGLPQMESKAESKPVNLEQSSAGAPSFQLGSEKSISDVQPDASEVAKSVAESVVEEENEETQRESEEDEEGGQEEEEEDEEDEKDLQSAMEGVLELISSTESKLPEEVNVLTIETRAGPARQDAVPEVEDAVVTEAKSDLENTKEQKAGIFSGSFSEKVPSDSTEKPNVDAEDVPEELSESIEENISDEGDVDQSTFSLEKTPVFLDLEIPIIPISGDSRPEERTPAAAPPQMNATYTVSSTASEPPVTPAAIDCSDTDATPKLPPKLHGQTTDRLVETVTDGVFPELVKEAIDSAISIVETSPMKGADIEEQLPLGIDTEVVGQEMDDDTAFEKVAEVASRLRSLSAAATPTPSATTPPPLPAPLPEPLLEQKRAEVPVAVQKSLDFIWEWCSQGKALDECILPEGASSTDADEDAEQQFQNLIFDTCKHLAGELMFKKDKLAPSTVKELYRAVFSQMAPFIGLQVPGASATSIPLRVQFATVGRRRDAVDEVLLSELYSEPQELWTDFSQDEAAIREEVVTHLFSNLLDDLLASVDPLLLRR